MTQNLEALDRGNAVRIERAELRAELRAGTLTFRGALDDPRAQRMIVWKVLPLLPGWGMVRINDVSLSLIRKRVMIGYGTRVRSLTVRQRLALIAEVDRTPDAEYSARRHAEVKAKPKPRPRAVPDPPALDEPPPRCSRCKARLLEESVDGLCGFCRVEVGERAA
jgi:hypothetical protein